MEIRTRMEPVNKYYFEVVAKENENIANLNREIREWLAQNCGCTWETDWIVHQPAGKVDVVGIYFDLDTPEEEMMAFKLTWT